MWEPLRLWLKLPGACGYCVGFNQLVPQLHVASLGQPLSFSTSLPSIPTNFKPESLTNISLPNHSKNGTGPELT